MPDDGICYFNCGPDSGASQPHKHLQIVPLPLAAGREATTPFSRLLEEACNAVTSGAPDSGLDAGEATGSGQQDGVAGAGSGEARNAPQSPKTPVITAAEVRQLPFRSYAARIPPLEM